MHEDVDRREVWQALAGQFLDSETRTEIPTIALQCVEAGLSVDEASYIWRCEVTPAVWQNCWSVAGEWGCWPRDWLVATIEAERGRWCNRPGLIGYVIYHLRVGGLDHSWTAIAACMRVLAQIPPARRRELTFEFEWLAHHFFDFCPRPEPSATRRACLRKTYESTFLPIFDRLVCTDAISRETHRACRDRVRRALET